MRVLVVETDFMNIHLHDTDGSLSSLQNLVGGFIECAPMIELRTEGIELICNEEGVLRHMPVNTNLVPYFFAGPVVLVGIGDEDFTSLTDEQITFLECWFNSIGTPWRNVSIEK